MQWLRLIADRIMGRNGKPSRPDTATRMAMDADFTTASRSTRPKPPEVRFTCPGFEPVKAANAAEAAKAFAERAAVSECGPDGFMRPMSIRFLRSDGAKTTFAAFVSCHKSRGITKGYDVFLTVEEVAEPTPTSR